MNSMWAVIQDGKIEPLKTFLAQNDTRFLINVITDDDANF